VVKHKDLLLTREALDALVAARKDPANAAAPKSAARKAPKEKPAPRSSKVKESEGGKS
jgi:hypothetical protein